MRSRSLPAVPCVAPAATDCSIERSGSGWLEASESASDLRRDRERGLALDSLHQGLQRRVRRRQDAGDLDQLREIPVVDDRDVDDELTPDASIVFEVEALDRLGEARRRRRRAGPG